MNVLIFPSGSLVAKEIYDSLLHEKHINLFGTDYDHHNFSSYYFDNYISGCPFIENEEETIIFLKKLIHDYRIDYIFPAFDKVIPFLKINESILTHILAPQIDVINICNSKLQTYNKLKDIVSVPTIYDQNEVSDFPVYVKPDVGYGTRNHKIIHNQTGLDRVNLDGNIILEYLNGNEYTVDCFSNFKGKVLYCKPRQRLQTRNGLSICSKTVCLPGIETFATRIQEHIKLRGLWFFQVKYDKNNKLKLLEIACRVSGCMCVNRVRGINFPLLTILDYNKINVDPILYNDIDVECYKVYKNLYKFKCNFDYVYCDLDDTIILNNKVNITMVDFLYQCLNNGKKLILLTRNLNPTKVLSDYRIALFEEIIKVGKNELKSSHISHNNSIFIDDAYSERYDVNKKCNILCFSPTDIELFNI